jgi:beta-N-acetylhexosaminidase
MNRKAIIISISKTKLTTKEKLMIKKEKPWGIILFKRNINDFNQVKKLINSIRTLMNDKKYPILIDEEGGRVSRLQKLINTKIFSQKYFGDLFDQNNKASLKLFELYNLSIIKILKDLGININTIPVLDLLYKKTHAIIGNRSFSKKIDVIKLLGSFASKVYHKNKLGTVIKHIPGHGKALSDSHLKLPKITKKLKYLKKNDFECFKGVKSFFAMTAHVLYTNIDDQNCATHSKKIINNIIRKQIGFKGIIISDDISMKALKYNLVLNAKKSLDAGCNLVLYCSGKYSESKKLLKNMPLIDRFTQKKTSEFYRFLS